MRHSWEYEGEILRVHQVKPAHHGEPGVSRNCPQGWTHLRCPTLGPAPPRVERLSASSFMGLAKERHRPDVARFLQLQVEMTSVLIRGLETAEEMVVSGHVNSMDFAHRTSNCLWLHFSGYGLFYMDTFQHVSVAYLVAQWWRTHLQCRRCRRYRFDPWVRKIPWRRAWQPTPIFLPEIPTDRGAWRATVHGVAKTLTWLSN